jgi:triacylglycerol lipase
MAKSINRLLNKIGAKKCHLVAHSFTGIDARAAITMFDAHKHVESLTTICTPHLGMKLID